jgi:Ca2+-transporting ATPase
VKALHQNKEIVAVTGDGVNDVIALKEADIGISMGVKGTDAAKEVADAVLADDNFVNIGHAIFEGRKFFDNLKKGVKYYLSVKTALILVFLLPVIFGLPFPFAPIQIIVLELFMDLAASSAFVAEPAERTIYNRKPRVAIEKFMNRKMIAEIFLSGFSLFALVMISYYYARLNNLSLIQTQTFAFTAWIIGHIILALISRSENEPLFKLGVFSNKIMNIWVLGVIAFLFVVIAVPSIGSDLKLTTLSINELILIFGISFAVIVWQELIKIFRYYNKIIQF